jgi:hypothetical protein
VEDTDTELLALASSMLRRTECVPLADKPGTEVHCMICHHEGEQTEHHGPDCELDKLQKRIARYLRVHT